MTTSDKPEIGSDTTLTCENCQQPFTFKWAGRRRYFCEPCNKTIAATRSRQEMDKIRNGGGNGKTSILETMALCTHDEARVRLAVWETVERESRGETNVEVNPVSKQTIQQTERRAINKIRKAMKQEWEDFKASLAISGGVTKLPKGRMVESDKRARDYWLGGGPRKPHEAGQGPKFPNINSGGL